MTQTKTPTEQALDDTIRPLWTRSSRIIDRRLREARSHAELGRMNDVGDAMKDLRIELHELLRSGRATFYRTSFGMQRSEIDRDILDHDVIPNGGGLEAAVRAPIRGRDQYRSIGALVDDAEGELRLANGITRPDPATRRAYHDEWERRHRSTIAAEVHGSLSNAQMTLFTAIGQLMIKPEVR